MDATTWHDIHATFGWVTVIANAAVGVWALVAHVWPAARVRGLWWCIGIAQITIFVQAGLGVVVQRQGYVAGEFHEFYGFIAIVAVAIIYSYRNQLPGRMYLLYGGGSLFVMGLCLRAMYLRS